MALYGSSKAAIKLLTKAWAAEYGPNGVRVNAVSPGPTRTEGTGSMGEGLEQLAAQAPARRPATADEIAEAIVFLATDRSSFIYGATLPVDGVAAPFDSMTQVDGDSNCQSFPPRAKTAPAVRCPLTTGAGKVYAWKNQRKGFVMAQPAQSHTPGPNKLPTRYLQFQKRFPEVFHAYDALGAATAQAGPLSDKTRALVKLALSVGAEMEGAVHSHTRRAVEAGCSAEEIYHLVLLGTTTLGFPTTMKAFAWVDDVLAQNK